MENKKILIVEDNPRELDFALEQAKKFNLEGIFAQDFSSAIQELNKNPNYVLSDLFFPAGNINQTSYIQKILPFYENYLSRFQKQEKGGVLCQALENVSKVFQITPENFVEEIMPLMNERGTIELARDHIHGIKNYSSYQKLQRQIQDIKQGKNMPYGYFLVEEAQRKNILARIVTSTDHHDITFEPIRNSLSVDYYDNLVDGHKQWARALENITERRYE